MKRASLFLGLLFCLILSMILVAYAHDAPSGWQYPLECCSNMDCGEVISTSRTEPKDGSLPEMIVTINRGGTMVSAPVPHNFQKVKPSPDNKLHACIGFNGQLICLFLPPGI